jgi:hypothetical protein
MAKATTPMTTQTAMPMRRSRPFIWDHDFAALGDWNTARLWDKLYPGARSSLSSAVMKLPPSPTPAPLRPDGRRAPP